MTQAVNLANFSNNLDTSGGLNPSALNAAVTVAKGGTGATTAANARTNLGLVIGTNVPSPTGTGASGTWGISISGNAATATNATNATSATSATNATYATTAGNGGVTSVNGSTGAVTVSSIGIGQTWQDVTGSRSVGTTYTNSTGKSIQILYVATTANSPGLVIDGTTLIPSGTYSYEIVLAFIIQPSSTYAITGSTTAKWLELR